MRIIPFVLATFLLTSTSPAHAQSVELYGSAGPTITDAGNSVSAGVNFSPGSKFSLLFGAERTHLSSRTNVNGNLVSSFRGGTLIVGSAELRFVPLGRDRVGPYVLGGFAAGQSRPNVTPIFPNRITNDVRALFAGGGILAPLNERVSLFADARMMFGAEGIEGIIAVAPVRAGVSWRF